jgi:hypothetical protein
MRSLYFKVNNKFKFKINKYKIIKIKYKIIFKFKKLFKKNLICYHNKMIIVSKKLIPKFFQRTNLICKINNKVNKIKKTLTKKIQINMKIFQIFQMKNLSKIHILSSSLINFNFLLS